MHGLNAIKTPRSNPCGISRRLLLKEKAKKDPRSNTLFGIRKIYLFIYMFVYVFTLTLALVLSTLDQWRRKQHDICVDASFSCDLNAG